MSGAAPGRRRVLAYGDASTSATGLGTVMRHVLRGLSEAGGWDIDLLAVNFTGDYYDREHFDYRIYPACPPGGRDVYGLDRLAAAVAGEDARLPGPWEVFFTICDHFVLQPAVPAIESARERLRLEGAPLSWVGYWPVDSRLREEWVHDVIARPDVSALYTRFGLGEVSRFDPDGRLGYAGRMRVVPHGVDTGTFRPLPPADVADYRDYHFRGRVGEDTFLVTNVNRNQWRKDLPRTMAAFAEFRRRVPDSFLYLHAAERDVGGDLNDAAREFGLVLGEDWSYPSDFDVNRGISTEELNYLYNASSVIVSTTLGEGWGFSITEAMAAGTLVVAPHHTSIPEILGNASPDQAERGISVRCGGPSLWVSGGWADNGRVRPLTDVEDMVAKLLWVHGNPGETERIRRRAYDWVQGLEWKKVVRDYWLPAFRDALA